MKKSLLLVIFGMLTASLWAVKSSDNARVAANRWGAHRHGFGGRAGAAVERVTRHAPTDGDDFFAVKFAGGGTAFVAGDGEDELPIAFTTSTNDFSSIDRASPMWALLERDAKARRLGAVRRPSTATVGAAPISSDGEISDMRVPPLVQSKWNQKGGIYNYYTPNGVYCGCVATAMSQVMRYHEYPKVSRAPITRKCWLEGEVVYYTTQGGAYEWANMPLVPGSTSTDAEKQAIGRLTSDAGIAVYMGYTSQGSGAFDLNVPSALMEGFGYQSAIAHNINKLSDTIQSGMFANFDAGYPVILGISDDYDNGHCIIGDGYGYEGGLPYVHLNLGWSGSYDLWYNLPNIPTDYDFNAVDDMVGNIFPTNALGSVTVSGRVTNGETPIGSVKVVLCSAVSGEHLAETMANAYGVWGFVTTGGVYSAKVVSDAGSGECRIEVNRQLSREEEFRGWVSSSKTEDYVCVAYADSFANSYGNEIVLIGANQVALPTADVTAGLVVASTNVMLSCSTDGAEIRYTLDGTVPDETSAMYTEPICIDQACTLKARAFKDDMLASPIMTVVYTWRRASKTFTVAADGTGDFVSLSNAVQNAVDGDVFKVRPGTYHGFVEVPEGACVVIESTDGPEVTIIDGDRQGCCFYGYYSQETVISGFTLTNGLLDAGAGICGGIATNCIVVGCKARAYGPYSSSGGGAYAATLYDCVIRNCSADYGGGAAESMLYGCYLYDNEATMSGGGAQMSDLVRCTVYGNDTSGTGGGVECYCNCYDSIIWGNSADDDALGNWEEWTGNDGENMSTYMEYCCTTPEGYKAGDGCINADPKFFNPGVRDFRLLQNSPCLGTAFNGGNMGAYRGSGEAGYLVNVEIVGCGSVEPPSTNVAPGGAVTFYASLDHPFDGFYINGVKVSSETEFTWCDVESDGTLTAVFLSTDFFVDAEIGTDDNCGWSWNEPLASVVEAAARAGDGETVFVKPGVYEGAIAPKEDAAVKFVAIEGPDVTSIFVPTSQAYCCFYGYASPGSMISGFTLTNGWDNYGGGIWGGTASNCVIRDCYAKYGGGGADSALLIDCVIADCITHGQGGGASYSTLVNCTVRGNRAGDWRSYESWYYNRNYGGGIDWNCLCTNTVVWGNFRYDGVTPDDWESYYYSWNRILYESAPTMFWCCSSLMSRYGANSITNDPLFASAEAADPRLYEISPCIGGGYGGVNIGAYRGAGEPKVLPKIDIATATGEEVAAAVASVGYADESVAEGIGTNAETYAEFQVWSTNGLTSKAVCLSEQAFDSFLVRDLVETPTLLTGGTNTELEVSALKPDETGKCSVTISLVDGDTVVPLRAAKEAFAAKTQLGSDLLQLAPADPSKVTAVQAADDKSVTLTIEPPASAQRYFMWFKLR